MPPFTVAMVATAEAVAAAEALAIAEVAAAAAAAAETAAATAAAAEAASAGITAAEAATAAETGAQGIMQAAPEVTNVAAEGSNVAAQQMQEQAVKQGLEQAVNPNTAAQQVQEQVIKQAVDPNAISQNQAYLDQMEAAFKQQNAIGDQSRSLGNLADWDSGVNPVGDAVKSPLSEVINKATSPTIDPLDPYGGFPSSGPTPPPASTESAANVINQGMQQPPNPFMQAYEYVDKMHPLSKGLGAYGLLSASGALRQEGASPPGQRTFNNPYTFSKDFKGTHPNPNDYQYTPRYAMGGITNIPPQTNFANPSQSTMGTSQYDMPTDPMSGNIANRMAEGGVTGSGQMQLNVPINVGGAGGGGGGGSPYTPAGGGGGGGYAPPGGPQGGGSGLGSLTDMLKGRQINPLQQALIGPTQPTAQLLGPTQSPPMTSNDPSITSGAPIQRGLGGKGGFAQPADNTGKGMSFARGGITNVPGYKRGGDMDVYDASLRFADMLDNPSRYTPPDTRFQSVDTFRDTNPNTANKLADEAAETRRKAIEQRSYVNTGAKFPTVSRRPGQLDLGPVGGERGKYDNQESILAAQGGIMGYNLGGYANGGNPRLLRGPGDGMSDNIPATISDRQPARLADGEFVVPADVVSHLGNGSTEAGAKKLHEMMNSVRRARTGNPKQGKKINPNKFMPKK